MFIGSASYFTYGLLRPGWSNAGGQLAGFLGYDLVLILPVLLLIRNITPALLPNLIIYLAVLIYSGALAIYYLFLNRETRLFPRHPNTPLPTSSQNNNVVRLTCPARIRVENNIFDPLKVPYQ